MGSPIMAGVLCSTPGVFAPPLPLRHMPSLDPGGSDLGAVWGAWALSLCDQTGNRAGGGTHGPLIGA